MLDMFEIVLVPDSPYIKMSKTEVVNKLKSLDFAFKPIFMTIGDVFEEDSSMSRIRNFFNDFFFANDEKSTISLNNLYKVIVVMVGISRDRFQLILQTGDPITNGSQLIIILGY
jgi:hypothetical protein